MFITKYRYKVSNSLQNIVMFITKLIQNIVTTRLVTHYKVDTDIVTIRLVTYYKHCYYKVSNSSLNIVMFITKYRYQG